MGAFLFFIFYFFEDGRHAFKFKMATNFSVQNDRQLFIYSCPSKLSQNVHSISILLPDCLCMFISIAFSLQQNANKRLTSPILLFLIYCGFDHNA